MIHQWILNNLLMNMGLIWKIIESILNKCKVYTYEEYDNIKDPGELTFFTRAKYEIHTELLHPKFDEWKKGCICKKPLNPDQLYIKCDKCNGWFHPKCCGINEKESDKIKNFVDCRSKKPEERELFIAEGLSALGSLKAARNAENQALLPIRGKLLNTLKTDYGTIFNAFANF